jgi:hypothetical protein
VNPPPQIEHGGEPFVPGRLERLEALRKLKLFWAMPLQGGRSEALIRYTCRYHAAAAGWREAAATANCAQNSAESLLQSMKRFNKF